MAAVASIDRNLEAEDAANERAQREYEGEMSDDSPSPPEASDEMRNMAARDIHVYQKPPSTGSPTAVPQAVAKPVSTLAKAALVAALLGSGGIGAVAMGLLSATLDPPPAVDATDNDTQFELRLVPPPENDDG